MECLLVCDKAGLRGHPRLSDKSFLLAFSFDS